MTRFGPIPLYIEILAPYNPRVSHAVVLWLMLRRRARMHLPSATFIVAVIDAPVYAFNDYGASAEGRHTSTDWSIQCGRYALWVVRECSASEGGDVPTGRTLVPALTRCNPLRSRPRARGGGATSATQSGLDR